MKLTVEQRQHIRDRALETVYEDVQQNVDYLRSVVRGYVEAQSPVEQARLVSSDPSLWPDLFDFDPESGQPWPEAS